MGDQKNIYLLGATGFVGRALVTHLANRGHQLTLLTHNRERHRRFLVMPNLRLQQIDAPDQQALAGYFAGADAVINLIGILNGTDDDFQFVHAELPEQIAAACVDAGVPQLLQMSALNANANANAATSSAYLRSKGAGEDAAHAAGSSSGLSVTSFQPSVIFGPGDGFFNRFAKLLKIAPALPLACPNARFAPVYIGDVVAAISAVLDRPAADTAGRRYQLCGPRVYTLKELVEYTAELSERRRLVLGLPDKLSRVQAKVFDGLFKLLPGDPPFSFDNYLSLQTDSVSAPDAPGLAALGVNPTSVESVMPRLFGARQARGRYQSYRRASRR